MIRILLKSHSINYKDREGPLAAQNTNWWPNWPLSAHPGGGFLGLLCDLGCALPSLVLPVQARLCLRSPGHSLKVFSLLRPGSGAGFRDIKGQRPGGLGWLPRAEEVSKRRSFTTPLTTRTERVGEGSWPISL